MKKIKKQIRLFSLWLSRITSSWVVPDRVWRAANNYEITLCEEFIEKTANIWKAKGLDDPEIVRFKCLLEYLKDEIEKDKSRYTPLIKRR